MKSYIFMNHHIRDPKSKEPVISIQTGSKKIYANRVTINGRSVICTGSLSAVKTHTVRAWIECDSKAIEILE